MTIVVCESSGCAGYPLRRKFHQLWCIRVFHRIELQAFWHEQKPLWPHFAGPHFQQNPLFDAQIPISYVLASPLLAGFEMTYFHGAEARGRHRL